MKTDRRDAIKLARCYRAGELTAVWVPDAGARGVAGSGARPRGGQEGPAASAAPALGKFLLRQGRRPPAAMKAWTREVPAVGPAAALRAAGAAGDAGRLPRRGRARGRADRSGWSGTSTRRSRRLPAEHRRPSWQALQALRGVARLTAVTIVAEVGELSRFAAAAAAHGLQRAGVAASTRAGGREGAARRDHQDRQRHLRRVVVEAAWAYRHRPAVAARLRRRQEGSAPESPRSPGRRSTGCTSATGSSSAKGKTEQTGRDRRGARAARLRLGHRRSRSSASSAAQHGSRSAAASDDEEMHVRAERAAVEGHAERRILVRSYAAGLSARTRVASPRQLPTDHDHDGEPRARSANIRVINRRAQPPGPLPDRLHASTEAGRRFAVGSRGAQDGAAVEGLCRRLITLIFADRARGPPSWS